MNLDGKSKTPGDIWNGKLDGDKEEATIVFRGTDLLQGVPCCIEAIRSLLRSWTRPLSAPGWHFTLEITRV